MAPDSRKRLLRPCWQMRCARYLEATGRQLLLRLDFGQPRLAIERVVGALSNAPRPSALQPSKSPRHATNLGQGADDTLIRGRSRQDRSQCRCLARCIAFWVGQSRYVAHGSGVPIPKASKFSRGESGRVTEGRGERQYGASRGARSNTARSAIIYH
jgi:hypothetical protein